MRFVVVLVSVVFGFMLGVAFQLDHQRIATTVSPVVIEPSYRDQAAIDADLGVPCLGVAREWSRPTVTEGDYAILRSDRAGSVYAVLDAEYEAALLKRLKAACAP